MKINFAPLLLLTLLAMVRPVQAGYYYVGSWQVYDPAAPAFDENAPNGPMAYTGLEAAALLFGGSPADYAISTLGMNPAMIDHMAWYDVLAYGAEKFSEDYSNKYLGMYYGPSGGGSMYEPTGSASAFVQDNLVSEYNYAFRWSDDSTKVPDATSTLALSALALGAVVAFRRRH
jgi:hypothetical protein